MTNPFTSVYLQTSKKGYTFLAFPSPVLEMNLKVWLTSRSNNYFPSYSPVFLSSTCSHIVLSACIRKWAWSLEDWEKLFPHCGHRLGVSSCVCRWALRRCARLNFLPHSLQAWDFLLPLCFKDSVLSAGSSSSSSPSSSSSSSSFFLFIWSLFEPLPTCESARSEDTSRLGMASMDSSSSSRSWEGSVRSLCNIDGDLIWE